MGLFNTKAGRVWPDRPPPLCTQQSLAHFSAASVAVDLVLLAAKHHGASQNAIGHGVVGLWSAGARAGETLTYVGVVGGAGGGGLAAGLGPARVASPAGLLVVELQIFQTLSQGQFLLDGHPQKGVQGLLLILRCSQLPLHLIQLSDVLVTTAREADTHREKAAKSGTYLSPLTESEEHQQDILHHYHMTRGHWQSQQYKCASMEEKTAGFLLHWH